MQNLIAQYPRTVIWIIIILAIWTIPWKAMALWKSARRGQVGWFLIFVLINTAGILEILYLKYLGGFQASNIEKGSFQSRANRNNLRALNRRR